jgi:hypothetical protein
MCKKKGQAAITDALFFLLIVVAVAVLLFRYSATYGSNIEDAINDFYFKEYSNSTVRALFYMTVPNDINVSYKYPETDYLMTIVKQDFYYNGKIGPTDSDINNILFNSSYISKYHLYNSLKILMQPLENYDYLFYIYSTDTTSNRPFAFFLLKRTEFTKNDLSSDDLTGRTKYSKVKAKYYLCDPDNDIIVRNVFSRVGKIYSSSIPIRLQAQENDIDATTLFAIWPSTVAISPEPTGTLTTDEKTQLKCKEI